MESKPLYIIGMGINSAIGLNAEETRLSLRNSHSGIGRMTLLESAHKDLPVGEVPLSNEALRQRLHIPADEAITRSALLGIMAVREALRSAGVSPKEVPMAFVNGTTVGGMDCSEQYYLDFLNNDSRNEFIALHDVGACTRQIAEHIGPFVYQASTSTACSSAANAIIHAARMLECGEVEMAVAGGTECLTKFHLNGFNSLLILDNAPCRPFCKTRAGLNLGEGAAYVVLETPEAAQRHSHQPLAILTGYGNACDAFHQTATSETADGPYLAMRKALEKGGLTAQDIDYVNAHGTATPDNDRSELTAMHRLFGATLPPFSSTKAFTGHTTSASGSIEAAICILALRGGFIPANLNWQEAIDAESVPVTSLQTGCQLRHVLCNSFGFGGNDASLLISAADL